MPKHSIQVRIARILKLVQKTDGCWLWLGYRNKDGYAIYSGRSAHRTLYTWLRGPIPDGLQLDHLCRVRHCVNPDHLEPVTCLTNVRRGAQATKTHCANGHLLSGDNLYTRPSHPGRRECRACRRAQQERLRKTARWKEYHKQYLKTWNRRPRKSPLFAGPAPE